MYPTPRKTPSKSLSRGASITPGRILRAAASPHKTPRKPLQNDQGEEAIQVAIRMRPLNANEGNYRRIWKVLPKYSSVTQTTPEGQPLPEKIMGRTFFTFDKTFAETTTTKHVYDSVAQGIVSSVTNGLNGTIFAYGQTSSGKTYTMQGSGTIEEGSVSGGGGIVHMAAADIFRHIQNTLDRIFLVRASFLEIYNEEVRDLLTENNETLQIREDPRRGVFVKSQEEIVTDFGSLLDILFRGEKSRAFAATAMNERSSRSHTIFRITIESRKKSDERVNDNNKTTRFSDDSDDSENAENGGKENDDGAVLISTLNLVDLAGSESVRHTGATGGRQKEGGMINQSLLTLSRVIVALGNPNQTHINFRDSKLTRILQPSLSGNARMAVICCATPSELYLEETRSTLQFASRAKLVKTNAQVNEVLDERSLIRRLQKELAEAKRQAVMGGGGGQTEHVKALEHKAVTAGTAAKEAEEKLKRLQASILNNGVLFGDTVEEDQKVIPLNSNKNRKRRLSEGTLLIETISPSKDTASTVASPKTIPRPAKQPRAAPVKPLAPSIELSLLKEALQAKNAIVAAMKNHVDDVQRLVQEKESAIVAAQCANDALRSERDSSKDESSALSSSLADLQSDLEQIMSQHKIALDEKDVAIAKSLKKLEQELNDRQIMEETIDSLQTDKLSLEKDLADLQRKYQDEQVQRQSQVEQMGEEISRLTAITCDQNKQLGENEEKVATLEHSLQDSGNRVLHLESTTIAKGMLLVRAGWDRDQLSTKLTESQLHSQNLGRRIDSLTCELVSTNHQLRTEAERAANLTAQLEKAAQKIEETTSTNQRLQSQLSDQEKEQKEVQSRLDVEVKRNKENLCAIGELEVTVAQLSGERDRVIESWESSKTYLEEAQQKINKLESDVKSSDMQLMQTRDDLSKLQGRETDLTSANAQLQENLNNLGNLLKQVTDGLSETSSQKATVEKELQARLGETSAALERIKSLEETIEHMESAADTSQKKIDTLEGQVAEALASKELTDAHLAVNKEKIDAKDARIGDLETSLESANIKIDNIEEELELIRLTKIELEQQIVMFKRNSQEMGQDIDNLVNELNEMKVELNNAQNAKSHLLESEQAARIRIAEMTMRIEEYEELERALLERHKASLGSQEKTLEAAVTKADDTRKECEAVELELETRTREHDTALSRLQETTDELLRGKNRVKELNDIIQSLEAAEHPAADALSSALREREKALERVSALEDQLQLCQSTVDDLQNQCNHITRRFRKVRGERDDARNILAFAQDKTTKLKSLVLKMESGHHHALQAAAGHKEALETQVLDLENRMIEIASSHAELTQKYDDQSLELSVLASKLSTKAEELNQILGEKEVIRTQLEAIIKEKSTAEHALGETGQKIAHLETRVIELTASQAASCHESESTIGELEASVGELRTRLAELSQQLENQSTENGELVSELLTKRDELQRSREAEASLDNRMKQLAQEKAVAESFRFDLAARIKELTTLQAKLEQKLNAKSSENEQLAIDMSAKTDMLRRLQEEANISASKIAALTEQLKNSCQEKCEVDAKMASREDDLIKVHEMLETANLKMNEMKQRIIDLEDELESKEIILSQSLEGYEADRSNYNTAVRELQNQIKDMAKANEVLTDRITKLDESKHCASDEKVQFLEAENLELKQLLVTSNQSIDEAREAANSAEHMVERKVTELAQCRASLEESKAELKRISENAVISEPHEDSRKYLKALSEKADLERQIVDIKSEHAESVSQLKRQLGDEQREIIRQADANMNALRKELARLESLLKKTESEAYFARQQKEELEDKNKEVMESVVQLESMIASIKNENARLKRASARLESDRESESRRLKEEVASLESKVVTLTRSQNATKAELETSRNTIQEMSQRIKQQDERVKKLEEAKLTRDQYKALKKLKEEHADYKKKLKKAEKELKILIENKKTPLPVDGLEDAEMTKLRFDKEALENKLRKYASHCQHLEQERANMLHVLRTTKIGDLAQNDLGRAIVKLCDKVTSLEEECDSLSKPSSVVDEVGEMERVNRSLQSQVDEFRKKTDKLQRSESVLKEELAALRRELEKLQSHATESRSSADNVEAEKARQVKYLERENLQLMKDLKTAKKKLQNMKAEINALRLQDADNTTMELSALKGRLASSVVMDVKADNGEKENGKNATKSPPPRIAKSPPPRSVPGLGQALPSSDDNTQECKQS